MANTLDQILRQARVGPVSAGLTTACWLWSGATDRDGYGLVHFKGERYQAHLFFWEQFKGKVPDGLELDHICKVRNCVNWDTHLEPVTKLENLRRAGKYKLSDLEVSEIRDIAAQGKLSHAAIAEIYAVTPQLIGMIVRGDHR